MEVASSTIVVNLLAEDEKRSTPTHSVESLTVFRDRLLAGCTDGSLLVFGEEEGVSGPAGFDGGVEEEGEAGAAADGADETSSSHVRAASSALSSSSSPLSSSGNLRLIETHSGFAKKPVLQLTAVGGAQLSTNLLISLTDGVSLHTLPNVSVHSVLTRTRGASAYRWRADDRRLCVACRKKLLVYKWDGVDLKEVKEIPLLEVPKTIEWAGMDTVCLAFKREYCIVSTTTGEARTVCPTGKHGEPSITVLPCGEILLLKDSVGIFVANDEGKPTRNHGINWSATPDDVVLLSWPHALAIMPRMVEVRAVHRRVDTDTGSIALNQTLPLQGCLAVSGRHGGGAGNDGGRSKWTNSVFVSSASGTLIHRIDVLPLEEQVRRLIEIGELEEAVEIASLYPCGDGPDGDHLELRRLRTELHRELADNLMRASEYEDAISNMSRACMRPDVVLSKFAALGLMPDTVLGELTKLSFSADTAEQAMGVGKARCASKSDSQRAMSALLPYLREQREDPLCPNGELLDTALLMLLLNLGDSRLTSFVCSGPRVDRTLLVDTLTSWDRHEELICYLKASKMHREALERIRSGAGHEDSALSAETMVEYIKGMGEEEVRAQVGERDWTFILQSNELCMREALPMMRAALPVEKSMALLRAHAPALCLEFMEDMNASGGDVLNVELLELYIKAALQEKQNSAKSGVPHLEWERGTSEIRSRLATHVGRCSSCVGVEAALEYFPAGALLKEKCELYRILKHHKRALGTLVWGLCDTGQAMAYADRVWETCVGGTWIDQLKDDDDGVEKGDAYGDEVVDDDRDIYMVLLEVLHDGKEAADGLDSEEGERATAPRDEGAGCVDAIAAITQLLNVRCERLDPLIAMSFIDEDRQLSSIERFLTGALLVSSEAHRNLSITKNLCRSQNLSVRNQHMTLCKTRVAVSTERLCSICNRRIGTSAFTVSTDGSLAHFGCHRDRRRAPVN